MVGSMLQRRSFGLLLIAFLVLGFGGRASLTHSVTAAEISSAAPALISASSGVAPIHSGAIVVTGSTFTPGGQVYVALYDKWGEKLYETRWTKASTEVFGNDGSMDPAKGYAPGGKIRESFDHLCGSSVMVRAYDQSTDSWSNWLDAQPNC